jgi:DNA-damage-inducible protein D
MDKEQIDALFNRFEEACYIHEGVECWSARELQVILGYARWENFKVALERARKACEGSGAKVGTIFVMSRKWLVWAVARNDLSKTWR